MVAGPGLVMITLNHRAMELVTNLDRLTDMEDWKRGLMDPSSPVVQRWIWGLWQGLFGDNGEGGPPR